MPTVISFSGVVGAGKSLSSGYVSKKLLDEGRTVYYIRFRWLTFKSFFEPRRVIRTDPYQKNWRPLHIVNEIRFQEYQEKSLLFFMSMLPYYLFKVYLFQLLLKLRFNEDDIILVDRFVYDHLSQYRFLGESHPNWIFRFIELIPKPDLAFVLLSSKNRIVQTLFNYNRDYLGRSIARYKVLKTIVPELILIEEDDILQKRAEVYREVKKFLEN